MGTQVTIYLPRHFSTMEAEQALPNSVGPVGAERGDTILAVDDDPTVRVLLSKMLRGLGYSVLEAWDGASARTAIDARIDLLVDRCWHAWRHEWSAAGRRSQAVPPGSEGAVHYRLWWNAAIGDNQLELGMEVLPKPFALKELATKIKLLINKDCAPSS